MTAEHDKLLAAVLAAAPEATARGNADSPAVTVPAAALPDVLRRLRDDAAFSFDMLQSHTAVDWIQNGTLELFYILYSLRHGSRLLVTVVVPRDGAEVPTVSGLFRIAEWQEREVFDMFGVRYAGHPDLRRLLLEDSWQGHPLRKDYQDEHILRRAP